jgi:hypothetical protein
MAPVTFSFCHRTHTRAAIDFPAPGRRARRDAGGSRRCRRLQGYDGAGEARH